MKYRFLIAAAFLGAVIIGCGGEGGAPTGPQTRTLAGPNLAVQNSCDEEYLLALSPALTEWHDSLQTACDTLILDEPPVYSEGGDPAVYLMALSPVLVKWQDSLEVCVDDDILDTPPVFADTTDVNEYLLELSPLLAQWKAALENVFGEDYLAELPAYSADEDEPEIFCPADTTVDCASGDGAVVEFEVTAFDLCDPDPSVVCDPSSGSSFPIGETMVTCTAADSAGNMSTCTFMVTVQDTTPPVIDCPGDSTLECTGDGSAILEFVATATDICDSDPVVECDPPSGSAFPLGETVVTCTATDAAGNSAECAFTVTVQDTTPPTVHSVTASPNELWPPNHKMVAVSIVADVSDLCQTPDCWIDRVVSSEDANGNGDGNTEPDFEIVDNSLMVKLRAERAGPGMGRSYAVYIKCMDPSGNVAATMVEVGVPHDKGKGGQEGLGGF